MLKVGLSYAFNQNHTFFTNSLSTRGFENDILVKSFNYASYHAEIVIPHSAGSQSGALGGDPLKMRSSLISPSLN